VAHPLDRRAERISRKAAGALGDVFELLGVRLEAVGAAAPVNELLGLAFCVAGS
jgi:hypothetical protein